MGGNHASDQRAGAERQGRQHRAFQIVKIIKKNNLRIHQKQDKIPRRQTGINSHGHTSKAQPGKENHTQQKNHQSNDELDSRQAHKLLGQQTEHTLLRDLDIASPASGHSLRVSLVAVVKMHLHTADEDHAG